MSSVRSSRLISQSLATLAADVPVGTTTGDVLIILIHVNGVAGAYPPIVSVDGNQTTVAPGQTSGGTAGSRRLSSAVNEPSSSPNALWPLGDLGFRT